MRKGTKSEHQILSVFQELNCRKAGTWGSSLCLQQFDLS